MTSKYERCQWCTVPFLDSPKKFNGLYHTQSELVEGSRVCHPCADSYRRAVDAFARQYRDYKKKNSKWEAL